ncbi:DUF523 domain-containing protein [Motiliproteus sp. SC1-56]|uniref:DUF523 domain-containing protein n=1 Tax=Motiliproteus sp. SC1-56 TaxID=2799565 RepID=UPI001A905BB7|nr:DUF523 domain-containing protein [Motiliproteus sp. SC1-56]
MEKILVSRCLLGEPVRYDGRGAPCRAPQLEQWRREGRLIAVCPELAGGLACPRPPAEVQGADGGAVLTGEARVLTQSGQNLTDAFLRGANAALDLCRQHGIRLALLKARSPSCGATDTYDGSFSGRLLPGVGVTAARLRRAGIQVFDEQQLPNLAAALQALEPGSTMRPC